MKFFLTLFLTSIISVVYGNHEYIKTVQCFPVGSPFSEPIIELGSDKQLVFSFDDLSEEVGSYSYRIIHCDPDWKPSGLSTFHYLEGFIENPLRNYEFSFNTVIPYVHYELFFPNEDIQLKLSGNYMLEIVHDDTPDSVVISQPFSVIENRVNIEARLRSPSNPAYIYTSQELGFTVEYDQVVISNPVRDLKVYVTQNQDPNTRKNYLPTFVRPNQLVYGEGIDYIFDGLSPYRNFQVFNLSYYTQYVRNIIRDPAGVYNVILVPGTVYTSYIPQANQNGNYLIRAENVVKQDLEAEYVNVHFAVYSPEKLPGEVYIYGKFSGWQLLPLFRMEYDITNKAYTGSIILKQGEYDYRYALLGPGAVFPDLVSLQGNFYQNRNEYNIRCYLRDNQLGYFRFIGYKAITG